MEELCSFVTVSQSNPDVVLVVDSDFNAAWLSEQIATDLATLLESRSTSGKFWVIFLDLT